ncbi:MAG: VCBS repeat-containing protein [Chitinophagaceae bacterium]|nr:VCBS repeat-containing protein [Chitinophagaceae bacterium]
MNDADRSLILMDEPYICCLFMFRMPKQFLRYFVFFLFACCGCYNRHKDTYVPPADPLFTQLDKSYTGIDFRNDLKEEAGFNVFNYRNFYNGGGVGIGDINNDGLADIYFTSNMGKNRLYLNKGNMQFEDITASAGVGGTKGWSTGVSLVDINGDGLLDIYVCNSGNIEGDDRANELFINQGNVTFKEEAAQYGLEEKQALTTHAAFFDYDLDGDLDCYILNNSVRRIGSFGYDKNIRTTRHLQGGHKLFRNDHGKFTDVSEQANIYGSEISFGLGVNIADLNGDHWPDIYINNDFFEKDYLYINQRNGTFKEAIEDYLGHISLASMGADIADINNDGLPEIFTTEMLPEDDYRLKTLTKFEDYDFFNAKVKGDFYYQYMQNALHLNNGDLTFSEIAFLSHTAATDWSWGALIFDLDNDGWKDIFVCNGIYKDITNQDFIDFLANDRNNIQVLAEGKFDFREFLDSLGSRPIPNYVLINQRDLTFSNRSYELGLGMPGYSNGAAYGDLDNDGDLDIIVNNVNMDCFVYRNNTSLKNNNHYLKIRLQGEGMNTYGVGARVSVHINHEKRELYQVLSRGFQSSSDPVLNFGLGEQKHIDSVVISWPDLLQQTLYHVPVDTVITVRQREAKVKFVQPPAAIPLYQEVSTAKITGASAHRENSFIDFDKERLIPRMISTEGPKCAVADVNGDGLDDFFVGGARNDSGKLFIQQRDGSFTRSMQKVFAIANDYDQTGVVFLDADNDGDNDLLVVYGGNEDKDANAGMQPTLYLNDGKGNFSMAPDRFKDISLTASCAVVADVNADGYADVFIGGRVVPGKYGVNPRSYLLINNGAGTFTDQTSSLAPDLQHIGMVTDAAWVDTDGDNIKELIVVGDWMPVTIFKSTGGTFVKKELPVSNGWWNCIRVADLNNDGAPDLVLGNLGLNSKIRGDVSHPVELYVKDFDGNGQSESILCYYKSDSVSYPLPLRGDLIMQVPELKNKFIRYADYAGKTIHSIFTGKELRDALMQKANQLQTCIALNDGKGNFTLTALPVHAQFSPVYSALVGDLDGDGQKDILLGGNFYGVKPEIGRYDASYSCFLKGDGKGNFNFLPNNVTGMIVKGEVRDIIQLPRGILFVKNNDRLQLFEKKRK